MPKRILNGQVISDKMDKTLKVRVARRIKHPLYKKYISKHKNYLVHDPDNLAKIGDSVSFIENVPISKRKKWLLINYDATKQGNKGASSPDLSEDKL